MGASASLFEDLATHNVTDAYNTLFDKWPLGDVRKLYAETIRLTKPTFDCSFAGFKLVMAVVRDDMPEAVLQELFTQVVNPAGNIDMLDLCAAACLTSSGNVEEKITHIFSMFDFDYSLSLEPDELTMIFASCIRAAYRIRGLRNKVDYSAAEGMSRECFGDIDKDNSGNLSLQEFTTWLRIANTAAKFLRIHGTEGAVDDEDQISRQKQFQRVSSLLTLAAQETRAQMDAAALTVDEARRRKAEWQVLQGAQVSLYCPVGGSPEAFVRRPNEKTFLSMRKRIIKLHLCRLMARYHALAKAEFVLNPEMGRFGQPEFRRIVPDADVAAEPLIEMLRGAARELKLLKETDVGSAVVVQRQAEWLQLAQSSVASHGAARRAVDIDMGDAMQIAERTKKEILRGIGSLRIIMTVQTASSWQIALKRQVAKSAFMDAANYIVANAAYKCSRILAQAQLALANGAAAASVLAMGFLAASKIEKRLDALRAEIKALTDRAAAEEKEDGDYKRAAKDAMRLSGTVEFARGITEAEYPDGHALAVVVESAVKRAVAVDAKQSAGLPHHKAYSAARKELRAARGLEFALTQYLSTSMLEGTGPAGAELDTSAELDKVAAANKAVTDMAAPRDDVKKARLTVEVALGGMAAINSLNANTFGLVLRSAAAKRRELQLRQTLSVREMRSAAAERLVVEYKRSRAAVQAAEAAVAQVEALLAETRGLSAELLRVRLTKQQLNAQQDVVDAVKALNACVLEAPGHKEYKRQLTRGHAIVETWKTYVKQCEGTVEKATAGASKGSASEAATKLALGAAEVKDWTRRNENVRAAMETVSAQRREWVLSQLSLGAKKKIMQLAALVAAQAAADAAVWQHGGYYVKMLRTQVELHEGSMLASIAFERGVPCDTAASIREFRVAQWPIYYKILALEASRTRYSLLSWREGAEKCAAECLANVRLEDVPAEFEAAAPGARWPGTWRVAADAETRARADLAAAFLAHDAAWEASCEVKEVNLLNREQKGCEFRTYGPAMLLAAVGRPGVIPPTLIHEGQLRTKQSINRYIGCVRGLETLRLEVVADVEKAAAAAAAASEALARATREMTLSSTDDDADLAFALSPKSVSAAMRGTPSSAVSRKGASGGGAISGSASTPGSTAQPVGAGTGNA